jgi:hypothetical protein
VIVQDGDPAPGGGTFFLTYEYSLNAFGDIAFGAFTPSGEEMLFLFSQGSLSLLARTGDPAPRGGRFLHFYHPVISVNGQVAFGSDLDSAEFGIFLRDADGSMTAVVRDGDPAPGGGASLYPISAEINDAGAVAFSAYASIYGHGGIFLFSNGEITREIRQGDPAPGGGVLVNFYALSLNSAGQIAFRASAITDGVFLFSDGMLTEVARNGARSPEGDTFTYVAYNGPPSLNAAGQVTFSSELEHSLGGIYLYSKGNLARIAGQGDPVDRTPRLLFAWPEAINGSGTIAFHGQSFPGLEELFVGDPSTPIARWGESALLGGVFDYFLAVAMNVGGQPIFTAHTSGGFSGLYSRSGGVLNRIVGTDDPAPGGGRFDRVDEAAINNAGDIAFVGYGNFPGSPAVFVLSGGESHRVVGFGDPVPGGGTFSGFVNLSLNDAGELAFTGFVSNRRGIFLWSNGSVTSIAQTGDPAPGGGTFFIVGPTIPRRYVPWLNSSGQIAFAARLSSPTGNAAVFLFSAGSLTRIAGPGDPAPGGGTLVSARAPSLNDSGEVAYAGFLSPSGSGIYLASQGTTVKIVGSEDPAPGGGTFASLQAPYVNSRTQVGFQGTTSLSGNYGVYLATPVR